LQKKNRDADIAQQQRTSEKKILAPKSRTAKLSDVLIVSKNTQFGIDRA
jgi:hypothetical protein